MTTKPYKPTVRYHTCQIVVAWRYTTQQRNAYVRAKLYYIYYALRSHRPLSRIQLGMGRILILDTIPIAAYMLMSDVPP